MKQLNINFNDNSKINNFTNDNVTNDNEWHTVGHKKKKYAK